MTRKMIALWLIAVFIASPLYADENAIEEIKTYINNDNYPKFHNKITETGLSFYMHGGSSKEFSEFLVVLWEGDKDYDPRLAWNIVLSDLYRTSVAGVMIMGTHDRWFDYDMNPVYAYMRKNVGNPSPFINRKAIIYLGIAGLEVDIPLFVELAESADEVSWRLAVEALGSMCSEKAGDSLAELERTTADDQKKAFIEETLQKYHAQGSQFFRCRDPSTDIVR